MISAYEADNSPDMPAVILFGPFVNRDQRRSFIERISSQPKLDAMSFDTKIEHLMEKAAAIVAMGGYNTFCEILSFDKRALIVPRTRPRLEQYIRAIEAERLGLVSMLSDYTEARAPERMAAALETCPSSRSLPKSWCPGCSMGLTGCRSGLSSHGARTYMPASEAAE